jgi:large subunit ribosomal protein L1
MPKVPKKKAAARLFVDCSKKYMLEEACVLVKKVVFAKFNEMVDLVVCLGVNSRYAD